MKLPKHRKSARQERQGINAVAKIVADLGQIWRETPNNDVGIDGHIEYVDKAGRVTGKIIAVQVKSGLSYFKDKGDKWEFVVIEKHLYYWEQFPLPVILILHHPEEDNCYWLDIRQALRTKNIGSSKSVGIPKINILNQVSSEELFGVYGILNQKFMTIEEVLDSLINTRNNNAAFPISYFSLFSAGLTNICRSLYFNMDLAMKVAEVRLINAESDFGIGVGEMEHQFLFGYIKFLVHQNIANIDFSDCLIDWNERKLQPAFYAPLTSRGKSY